jgi:hypothetical protein
MMVTEGTERTKKEKMRMPGLLNHNRDSHFVNYMHFVAMLDGHIRHRRLKKRQDC